MASSLALVALLLVSCAVVAAAATKYTVGDTSGWAMGADYTTWASDKKFKMGDTLVFNYAGGAHSVDEVSAADYAVCTASNALQSDSSGTTTVTLKTAGKHYFICGIAGHCSNGMKLVVDVAAASPAPAPKAPSTTPTTPSTTPATPASPGTSSGLTPTTPATVLAPPAKQSAGAAGLRAGSWTMLGLAGLAAVQLGLF
ncbi:blue copper protein-like [Oryza glaberrima]|uniref:Phytocyanin domain-containing protein n=1 Tax=Oryza glaberrima TaxID=4538 RepID=I1Q0P6_ORYGL|nr:blue copper protein-like [Oryza glaberrima]